MKKSNTKFDICLIFPPMAGINFCPPAGIPSLVAYLKSYGFNPQVLDIDSYVQNRNVIKRILLCSQFLILRLNKILFKESKDLDIPKTDIFLLSLRYFKKLLTQTKNKINVLISIIYKSIIYTRILIFRIENNAQTLEYVFEAIKQSEFCKQKNLQHIKVLLEKNLFNVNKIGISVIYPNQILYSLIIAKLIKEIRKDVTVVLGGSQITMHIHKFLPKHELTNYIDGFITHEGEVSLCNLLQEKTFNLIPNFYYKDGNEYKPSNNVNFNMPTREYRIPDFEGFSLRSFNALPIRTLRGCFWGKCRFCSYPYVSGKFDKTNPELVVESIVQLKQKYNVNRFEFIDSSLPAKFLREIAEQILAKDIKINWHCRVNYEEEFSNDEFVSLLKQSGCQRLAFGLESANQRITQAMNKMQKNNKIAIQVAKTLDRHGITSGIYVMFGFPTETKQEMQETFDFIAMLKNKYHVEIMPSVFNLLEHTYMYNNPHEFGIEKIKKESKNASHGHGYYFACLDGCKNKDAYALLKKTFLLNTFPFLYSRKDEKSFSFYNCS